MKPVPKETIKDILKTLFRLKLENSPESYISIKYALKLFSIPLPIISIPAETILYRTRIHEKCEYKIQFNKICDLSYRECRNEIKNFGRANEPFQSIFYCSDKMETAFFETSKLVKKENIGNVEVNSLGIWRVKEDINVVNLPKNKDYFGNSTVAYLNKEFNNYVNSFNNEDSKNLINFLHIISDEFSTKSNMKDFNYLLTCALANYAYETPFKSMDTDRLSNVDGITYPSVWLEDKGMNFALKPELIDNKLIELEKVIYREMQLTSKDNFTEIDTITSKSIDYNEWKIVWQ